MWNARLDETQVRIKIAGRIINNLRYADDTTLMAESKEKLKNLWWRWKRRVKKLALNSTFKKLRSWDLVLSLHDKQMEKQWKQWEILFSGLQHNKLKKWFSQRLKGRNHEHQKNTQVASVRSWSTKKCYPKILDQAKAFFKDEKCVSRYKKVKKINCKNVTTKSL